MHTLIVSIVNDTKDGQLSAEIIPHSAEFRRMFIFIGETPVLSELDFLTEDDTYLMFDNAIRLDQKAYEIALRAGILYSTANCIIFFSASEPPTQENIKEILVELKKSNIENETNLLIKDNCLCTNREHLLFHGFDDLYAQFMGLLNQENDLIDDFQLAQAMTGVPSSEEVIIKAIEEIVILENVSANDQPIKSGSLWDRAVKNWDNMNPKSYIFPYGTTAQTITSLTKYIPSDGTVIVELDTTDKSLDDLVPFQTLYIDNGRKILIFAKA